LTPHLKDILLRSEATGSMTLVATPLFALSTFRDLPPQTRDAVRELLAQDDRRLLSAVVTILEAE
jgi:hypothetical protein